MEDVVRILQARGLIEQQSSAELAEHLKQPRKVYIGFDPTADSLHLGNMMGLIVARWFQYCGHHPVALVGGATGMIGDPSGKNKERNLLDKETLQRHQNGIAAVLKRFLSANCQPQSWSLRNNYDWFQSWSLIDFLREVGKNFRMGAMLAKESVKTRIQSAEGMSFTEFSYQLLQGYDFLHLFKEEGVSLQIGGSDQWGNITGGIELVRKTCGKEVFGLTFPLLLKSDGTKFGKSEAGAVWLSEERCSAYEFYQYFMRVTDADVFPLLRKITFLDLKQIDELEQAYISGKAAPNEPQKLLAASVTELVHGKEGVEKAQRVTKSIQPGLGEDIALTGETIDEIAKDMPSVQLSRAEVVGKKLIEIYPEVGLVASRGEFRRLFKNGGIFLNKKKVAEEDYVIRDQDLIDDRAILIGVGKKKKYLVYLQN